MRIAVIDYLIEPTNPIGSCHRRMLDALCHQHEFTVFAVRFDNPCPQRIRFVRIPVPTRPLALLYILFHLVAPIRYALHRLRHGRFDLVQMVESNLLFGDVSYTHFCHRSFLAHHWKRSPARGLRGLLRRLDHALHALVEPFIFKRVKHILVPSRGLARELGEQYPAIAGKVAVIHNPIDLTHYRRPDDFDRTAQRTALGFGAGDTVLAFVALGHFERKGLPQLMEAVAGLNNSAVKLLVVGGEANLLADYRARAERLGIADQVVFAGMQRDVAPYLWAADAFAFPSFYETFSLVTFQAAAAGLPLIVSQLHGVEELLRDGHNGYLVEPAADSIRAALKRFMDESPRRRAELGENARLATAGFDVSTFAARWAAFYDQWGRSQQERSQRPAGASGGSPLVEPASQFAENRPLNARY